MAMVAITFRQIWNTGECLSLVNRHPTAGRHLFKSNPPLQAIQISRLTCRRFHNTSSQSLMPAVDVDLVQQFPARYDEIFAHPVFGKAVTIINFGSPGEPGALEDKNLLKDMGELATALAAVLKKAGGSVRTLNMNLVAPVDKKRLLSRKLTSDEVDLIRSAMRNIKRLRFYYGPITIPWPHNAVPTAYNRQELENLTTLVTALTDSGNLEDLELETNLWHCDPMSLPPNLGIVKAQASWASLSVLDLVGVSIHCSDLEHCLNRTIPVTGNIRPRQEHQSLFDKSRAPGVRLSRVHLVDKSWARILDILRERHSLAVLHSPSGAECEDMGFDTYNRLFGQYDGCTNVTEMEAERYIRGGDYVNPLRALSSEDIVDS